MAGSFAPSIRQNGSTDCSNNAQKLAPCFALGILFARNSVRLGRDAATVATHHRNARALHWRTKSKPRRGVDSWPA
jgi:hypothetical protein